MKMMYSLNGYPTLLLITLLNLLTLSHVNQCLSFILVPDQLHCNSEILIKTDGSIDKFERFSMDEFVDLHQNRSSARLKDVSSHRSKIYYNEIFEFDEQTKRQFFMFDTDETVCKSTLIYDWPLANIRQTVINLLPSNKLTSRFCDVAFGPSLLLLATKETMSSFHYLGSEDDQRHLVNSDLYEYVFSSFETGHNLIAKIRTKNHEAGENYDDFKTNKTLADIANANKKKVKILSVEVCNVESENLQDTSRRVNKEFDCMPNEFLFQVHFFLVAQLTGGPLFGQGSDEDHSYDFYKDPFTLPIGIGCWAHVDPEHKNHRKVFTIERARFSAQYITSNGTRGLSYVAYDSENMLLRLDRDGRKGIYDLDKGLSYHEDEFRSIKLSTDSTDMIKNCIVLQTSAKMFGGLDLMQKLLGLAHGTSAPYLGSKMIDHFVYSVYEIELVYSGIEKGYNLPILLELAQFSMPSTAVTTEKRFFVTYYVTQTQHQAREQQLVDPISQTAILKYIELWQFNVNDLQRHLLNRLEFGEFSWSLDVGPTDDLTLPDPIGIFNVGSCAQQRDSQLQLNYRVNPDPQTRSLISTRDLKNLYPANQWFFKQSLLSRLVTALDIPRLNVAHFEVATMKNSYKLLIESRIVELPRGEVSDELLGFVNYDSAKDALKHHVLSYNLNRHSLDSCRLDSLTEPSKNSLMYCESLALCVIIKQEPAINYIEKLNGNSWSSYQLAAIKCSLYRFSWTLRPIEKRESILTRVFMNKYRLCSGKTRIQLKLLGKNNEITPINYIGCSFVPEIKRLDATISSEDRSPAIVSMRHTTSSEDPKASNSNIAINVPTSSRKTFNYCQLACQIDAYCDSFSICLRKKSKITYSLQSDCVLSSFRLTGESIEQLKALPLETNSSGYTPAIKRNNSSYTFYLDHECNLHPKDVLLGSLEHPIRLETTRANDTSAEKAANRTFVIAQEPLVMSLKECADLSHRNSVGKVRTSSNFVYCHLKSYCLPHQDKDDILPQAIAGQICYLYTLSHTQFYEKMSLSRLAITKKPIEKNQPLDLIEENKYDVKHSIDSMRDLKVGRSFMNLDSSKCAELCDLHKSNCLAFDTCQSADGTNSICFLYSIRSPFSRVSKKLKLTELEGKLYGVKDADGNQSNGTIGQVTMVSDPHCNHYYPKLIYLELKLSQFQQSIDARGLSDKEEAIIIEETQKQSDKLLEERLRLREELSRNSENESKISWTAETTFCLLGLLTGIVGTLYVDKGFCRPSELWQAIKTGAPLRRRHGRDDDRRMSQITLSLDQDL